MRKYITMLAVATLAVACQKDNVEIPSVENLSDALTIRFSDGTTRGSFDENNSLAWVWDADDKIIGYQNAGEKSRNTLTHESEGTFSCAEFTYDTTEPAQFHFFYSAIAEQEGKLVAEQEGVWNPILVGSTTATTLQNIGTVELQHLSSALEIRTSYPEKITNVSLTSENDFVGSWSVNDDLSYTQDYNGNSITLSELETNKVVINMPVLTEAELEAKAITLSVTTTTGAMTNTVSKTLENMSFVAGKRTIINIRKTSALLDRTKFLQISKDYLRREHATITRIEFKTCSTHDTYKGNKVQIETTEPAIYLVLSEDEKTLEIHTPASEVIAPEGISHLFGWNGNNIGCSYITSAQYIDLSGLNTSNVTNISYLFQNCNNLKSINLSNFDFSKVTSCTGMLDNVGKDYPNPKTEIYVTAAGKAFIEANKNTIGYDEGKHTLIVVE